MKKLTHMEFSMKGGKSTLKKHGKKHFKTISKLAAEARKANKAEKTNG